MSPEHRPRVLVPGVLILSLMLAACGTNGGGLFGRRGRSFSSNGERIYFTATSSSGDPITYSEGPGRGGMMRGRLACADCHGADGQGGRVTMMMETFQAPNITWPALTGEHGGRGGEEEHPPYTEGTVKRAITDGVNPASEPLNPIMPRWRMSERDLDDLVAYLKTLD